MTFATRVTFTLLALSLVTPTHAADLAARTYVKAPTLDPAYDWTGFYAGLHAGYGWGDANVNSDLVSSNFDALIDLGVLPASVAARRDGFIGGGQIGYNQTYGAWVLGLETDLSYADFKGGSTTLTSSAPAPGLNLAVTETASAKTDVFGTLRARVGFIPVDRLLLFGTGGLAYGHTSFTTSINSDVNGTPTCAPAPGGFCGAGQITKWSAGWTLGGGFEYALGSNWSAKAEYLFYDLGTISHTFADPAQPAQLLGTSVRLNGNIVRAGINYKFGGPVVARY